MDFPQHYELTATPIPHDYGYATPTPFSCARDSRSTGGVFGRISKCTLSPVVQDQNLRRKSALQRHADDGALVAQRGTFFVGGSVVFCSHAQSGVTAVHLHEERLGAKVNGGNRTITGGVVSTWAASVLGERVHT